MRAVYQPTKNITLVVDASEAIRLAQVEADRIAAEGEALEATPDPVIASAIHGLAVTAGLSDFAAHLAIACETIDAAQSRIRLAGEIVALCSYAKKPEAAAPAIRANQSLADVRAALLAEMADEDVHTSSIRKIDPKATAAALRPASTASIWAAHNAHSK